MADLIRREELLTSQYVHTECYLQENKDRHLDVYKKGWNDALQAAHDNAPAVDAVEVVRCHKCIHWDEDTVRRNSNDATWWNEAVCRKYSDDIWEAWKDADWFCADGERRNNG